MKPFLRLRAACLTLLLLGLAPFPAARAQDTSGTASEMPPPTSNDAPVKDDTVYSCLTIFTRVLQLVRQDYVDEDKVDYKRAHVQRAARNAQRARPA